MWRKNNSLHITSWFVITRWRGRLCDNCSFRHLLLLPVTLLWGPQPRGLFSVWFGYVWQEPRRCFGVTGRFSIRLVSTFACFLSLQRKGWNEGHAGFGPTCLLWGLPPLFPPTRLPFKDFSHFCARCCFGNRSWARHMGASCGIPESLSGRAQQEFFPTAHIVSSAHTWDIFMAVN